ncbi:MAG: aldose epimerase family protein [Planctomycetota bacterium]|jgi:aldose 1-epimerase
MKMFRKGFNFKLILLVIAILLSIANRGYAIDLSEETCLRVPSFSQDQRNELRAERTFDTYSRIKNGQWFVHATKGLKKKIPNAGFLRLGQTLSLAVKEAGLKRLAFAEVAIINNINEIPEDERGSFCLRGKANNIAIKIATTGRSKVKFYVVYEFLFQDSDYQRDALVGLLNSTYKAIGDQYFSTEANKTLLQRLTRQPSPNILFFSRLYSAIKWERAGITGASLLLGASARKEGLSFEISDVDIEKTLKDKRLSNEVRDKIRKADVIGITLCENYFDDIAGFLKIIRNETDAIIAIGGPMATLVSEHVLALLPEVNLVVRGAGEEVFLNSILALQGLKNNDELTPQAIEELSGIDGILVRLGNSFFESNIGVRNESKNLDQVDIDFSFLQKEDVVNGLTINTSRGCPQVCIFCTRVAGRIYRAMCPDRIIYLLEKYESRLKEIEQETGEKLPKEAWLVSFNDDDFLLDPERVVEFIDKFIAKSGNTPIRIASLQTSIYALYEKDKRGRLLQSHGQYVVNQRLIDSLSRLNKVYPCMVGIGTDSFSDKELGRLKKSLGKLKFKDIERATYSLDEKEIPNHHFWIMSNIDTDWEDLFINIYNVAKLYGKAKSTFNLGTINPYTFSMMPSASFKRIQRLGMEEHLNKVTVEEANGFKEYDYTFVLADVPYKMRLLHMVKERDLLITLASRASQNSIEDVFKFLVKTLLGVTKWKDTFNDDELREEALLVERLIDEYKLKFRALPLLVETQADAIYSDNPEQLAVNILNFIDVNNEVFEGNIDSLDVLDYLIKNPSRQHYTEIVKEMLRRGLPAHKDEPSKTALLDSNNLREELERLERNISRRRDLERFGRIRYGKRIDGTQIKDVRITSREGYKIYNIEVPDNNVSMGVCEKGATVISFKVGGKEILLPSDTMQKLRGIPFMVPPNRIEKGIAIINGEEVDLNDIEGFTDDGEGNRIHGPLRNMNWKFEGVRSAEDGATLEFSLDISNTKAGEKLGKAEYRLIYTLSGNQLRKKVRITNKDNKPIDIGFAWHDWTNAIDIDSWEVLLPAKKYCDAKDLLPTGDLREVNEIGIETGKILSLEGKAGVFDHVLTDLELDEDGWATSVLYNKKDGTLIRFRQDGKYLKYIVFFTHPDGKSICVEAQSCFTNAHNLKARGIDSDLITIQPGQTIEAECLIEIQNIGPGRSLKDFRDLSKLRKLL